MSNNNQKPYWEKTIEERIAEEDLLPVSTLEWEDETPHQGSNSAAPTQIDDRQQELSVDTPINHQGRHHHSGAVFRRWDELVTSSQPQQQQPPAMPAPLAPTTIIPGSVAPWHLDTMSAEEIQGLIDAQAAHNNRGRGQQHGSEGWTRRNSVAAERPWNWDQMSEDEREWYLENLHQRQGPVVAPVRDPRPYIPSPQENINPLGQMPREYAVDNLGRMFTADPRVLDQRRRLAPETLAPEYQRRTLNFPSNPWEDVRLHNPGFNASTQQGNDARMRNYEDENEYTQDRALRKTPSKQTAKQKVQEKRRNVGSTHGKKQKTPIKPKKQRELKSELDKPIIISDYDEYRRRVDDARLDELYRITQNEYYNPVNRVALRGFTDRFYLRDQQRLAEARARAAAAAGQTVNMPRFSRATGLLNRSLTMPFITPVDSTNRSRVPDAPLGQTSTSRSPAAQQEVMIEESSSEEDEDEDTLFVDQE